MTNAHGPSAGPHVEAPRDLAAWTRWFTHAEIPILAETAGALEDCRANEDAFDANSLGEMIGGDPLMTLKLLAYESSHRGRSVVTSSETVISALVMMGISPFFRAFGPQPTVDEALAAHPDAMAGLDAVLRRARRGADFALAFAVHRTDPDAAVIHSAALLHEFAEMLLWCHAPSLALQVRALQSADATLRSTAAQRAVLHIELGDLQRVLAEHWKLPPLIVESTADAVNAAHTSVRIVALATRLARHTSKDWENAAVPDDVADIASLLNLSHEATVHLLRDI